MLRISVHFAFKELVLPHLKKRNCPLSMMSSVLTDSVKRKTEENSDDEVSCKKAKVIEEEPIHEEIKSLLVSSNRYRKPKKAVLLLSYLGKEYYGMQRNHDVSTVEEELLKALLESEIIIQDEFDHPKTMKFQRAARTDKGVSAVRQIVSLKLPVKEIADTLPEKVNKFLPPEIRLIATKRVIQSFDAKVRCDARTYSYMLPTFAFSLENDEEYRITDDKIEEVNKFLQNYLGTHNFFNFTSGRLQSDPSCKRFIISCECGPPFMSHGIEYAVVKVKGQSFMLHQIRKMVGLAIAFMRNLADESVLLKAWEKDRIDIPKAPGLGLMLEELHYDWYNSKYGSDGMHEPLIWSDYDEIVNKFKMEKICANIAITEREEKSMMQWLETLPQHTYDIREDGPPSALPPTSDSSYSTENKDSCTKSNELSIDNADSTKNSSSLSSKVFESSLNSGEHSDSNSNSVENITNSSTNPPCTESSISNEKEIKCKS